MSSIAYALVVDGAALDPAAMALIKTVDVEEHVGLAAMLRLTFGLTPRVNASGWQVLDDDLFPRLAKVKLTTSVGSRNSQTLIEGYVVEVVAEFSNDPSAATLRVIAFDSSVLMNLEEKARAWAGMADSDIATTIFGEYGFSADVEATQPTRDENVLTMIQRSTDIQFLLMLARRNGYDCFVEVDANSGQVTGHFHPARYDAEVQGVLSLGMGQESTVDRMTLRYDMLRPVTAQASNLDVESSDNQEAEITSVAATALGGRSTLSDDRPRMLILRPEALTQTGELQTLAQAVIDRAALAIHAEGELNTQSYGSILRANRPVLVRGVGRDLSGTYYVERVQHSFEAGSHRQSFSLRRNALGVAGHEEFGESAA